MALVALAIAVIAAGALVWRSRNTLPAPGSETYEQVTRAFYHGLAALEVGLLDDAKREFTTVTTEVEEEPAAWANLGLTHLRLGELDAAAMPIEHALTLAPENADLALLAGRMEIARGSLDDGVAHLRRAVELAADALQPRFALAEEVERSGAADGDAQALTLLDELMKLAPQNMAVLVERARVAAKAGDLQRLNDSIARLKPMAANWPELALQQYQELQAAVGANDLAMAQRATAFLRNVLARVPAFGEDLGAVRTPTELIAEPVQQFIALAPSSAMPAEPDLSLRFAEEPLAQDAVESPVELLFTVPGSENAAARIFAAQLPEMYSLNGPPFRVRFRESATDVSPNPHIVAVADWNNDFRPDVVTGIGGGVRLLIQQADGQFLEQTPTDATAAACRCTGVWAADVEMDGDLDVIAAADTGGSFVLRNNGDGGWTSTNLFAGVNQVVDFGWADLDGDADPDAVFLDRDAGSVRLRAFANRQAGDFVALPAPPTVSPQAMTIGDMDSDGVFDVVVLEQSGTVRAMSFRNDQWRERDIATWTPEAAPARLIVGDFDNNGAMDLVGTTERGETRIWLSDTSRQLRLLERSIAGRVFPAGDLNSDGRIDLIGITPAPKVLEPTPPGQPPVPNPAPSKSQFVRFLNQGNTKYHWKEVRPRAQATAGDQRINSFGVGGFLEARAGLLFQKQLLTGGPVHIGLGTQSTIDVARIVWPNGVPQAEFATSVDDVMVAEQRLKGSCPWLFTWNGTRMVFVTDFLWRSPLGLRINAQDTAGVTQTEDWVKLRGDQLVPRDGIYDVRITAELWETHFFDHVSLLAVDRPAGTEVFVDERFSPVSPPALSVQAVKDLHPVVRAWDHRGADVTSAVSVRDGNYLSTFARGRYQGIADDHFVEIDPGAIGPDTLLVANGWIYPTDSSINVAIAQAGIAPRGLSLEAQGRDGSWRVVNADIGFPAGKNKTILIDLRNAGGARRLRLRTNLEIYWDSLQLGSPSTSPVKTTRVQAAKADLRYRGFSQTGPPEGGHYVDGSPRGDAPETPQYDRIVSTSPRWRDLTGYHTRFGDVLELIGHVDDRYVIMNAGDEMRLQFTEIPAPPAGWTRDFVLIGDGWEKDGDYNTGFSQTVLPLPSHDTPNYGAGTTSLVLEDDPVYQRHRDDWQRYHTRYVTPQRFLRGLAP
ncbi:MAG TPA: FG-GAP-like repeat-containing protein [Vicinamibacterales bacterium]|nr:FG-GAP-like repeat-containing protein [Vicinamibacterales bacterium]